MEGFIQKNLGIIVVIVILLSVVIGVLLESWEAMTAVGTLSLALVTSVTLWWNQKDRQESLRRQITEVVFSPLVKTLDFIVSDLKRDVLHFTPFNLRDIKTSNIYLYYQIKQSTVKEIENFNIEFERVRNSVNQLRDTIINAVFESIHDNCGFGGAPADVNDQTREMLLQSGYRCMIGGQYRLVAFWQLILTSQNLSSFLDEMSRDLCLPNNRIENEEFFINGLNTLSPAGRELVGVFIKTSPREKFEKTLASINAKIDGDPDLRECFKSLCELYSKAQHLKGVLENFEV